MKLNFAGIRGNNFTELGKKFLPICIVDFIISVLKQYWVGELILVIDISEIDRLLNEKNPI